MPPRAKKPNLSKVNVLCGHGLITALDALVLCVAAAPLAKVLALLDEMSRKGWAEHGHPEHVVAVLDKAALLFVISKGKKWAEGRWVGGGGGGQEEGW